MTLRGKSNQAYVLRFDIIEASRAFAEFDDAAVVTQPEGFDIGGIIFHACRPEPAPPTIGRDDSFSVRL